MVFWVWIGFGVLVAATIWVVQAMERDRQAQRRLFEAYLAMQTAAPTVRASDGPVTCIGCQCEFGTLREWAHHDCPELWLEAEELRRAALA